MDSGPGVRVLTHVVYTYVEREHANAVTHCEPYEEELSWTLSFDETMVQANSLHIFLV